MSHRDSPKIQGILKNDEAQPVSPSSLLGVNYARSPRDPPKSVSIASRAEAISPLMLGSEKDVDELELERIPSGPRQHKARGPNSKRLSGRRAHNPSISSMQSVLEQQGDGETEEENHLFSGGLVGQVTAWLREEKAKRAVRKERKAAASKTQTESQNEVDGSSRDRRRSSDESIDLSRLEQILKESLHLEKPRRPSILQHSSRKKSSVKSLHRSSNAGASSDTEYLDGDALVPSAEAWLDNTKTLAMSGASTLDLSESGSISSNKAWASFKYEIVRLTHTLRLKGWRRVPMEMSNEIDVERLSGALTNAVYVVSPPQHLPERPADAEGKKPVQRPPPPKLLLRIYGPQVEHLIDRESELQILRRLARKRIGPRLLGTFSNGRFEEFFHARALTPQDLRNPDTSKQIAKRMRELHEGIELLERERDDGAFVWRNWDKWFQRVRDVVSWLDGEIMRQANPKDCTGIDSWKTRGFVCGTDWTLFQRTVERYRQWLEAQYTQPGQLRQRYVFAHNDTQYGNILRMMPSGTSPLLLPANTHKQLIVIDFEYANANTPGLEFANHFTEWCYNYHDALTPWRCNTSSYPTREEQDRFVRAYVRHRPQFNVSTPSLGPMNEPPTPPTQPTTPKRPAGPTSSISNFMLDARAPPDARAAAPETITTAQINADAEYKAQEDAEVKILLRETRMWRLANSAQWVAWGIVQAKVPGMPDFSPGGGGDNNEGEGEAGIPSITNISASPDAISPDNASSQKQLGSDPLSEESLAMKRDIDAKRPDPMEEEDVSAEEEFDYLAYARDRAMFFWGDALALGLVEENELPEDVRVAAKTVDG